MTKAAWMIFPSRNAERAAHTVRLWHARGYSVLAILEPDMDDCGADLNVHEPFVGYWANCNRHALSLLDVASAVVLAADDMDPDPDHEPAAIVAEMDAKYPDGYVVMQPTGDPMDGTDRICGSPWFGLGWIRESHGGRGPCPYGYRHFYGDEELFNVAKAQGVLWQRADLTQRHNHWCRRDKYKTVRTDYQLRNSDLWWDKDKALFQEEMAAGFPGSGRKKYG
jgi:hypothetical protein